VVKRIALAVVLSLLGAGLAGAQSRLGYVSVDRVRITGGGNVQAWVSVLDPDAVPVAGLDASSFAPSWDGRTPDGLIAEPVSSRDPELRLTVLVDPGLVRDLGGTLRGMLEILAGRAGDRDRVRVAAIGGHGRGASAPLSRAGELSGRLEASESGGPITLYDDLFREVRSLARLPKGRAGAVLLVTRGVDTGSRHAVPEVLAISGAYAQHVPVLVLLLDSGGATESERLAALAQRSGGSFERLDGADKAIAGAQRAVQRLRGAYVLSFHDPRWDGKAERHVLEVAVNVGGEQRRRSIEVVSAEVMARAWWQGPLPLVLLGVVILLASIAVPLIWRRPMLKLVVLNGEEKGCSYELYAMPVTLGAAVGNDLTFPAGRVSRSHAVFERRGSGVELVDLNSENGTFVNGDRVTRRRLSRGDRVSLGGAVELEVRG
jgi:hypothetical protein